MTETLTEPTDQQLLDAPFVGDDYIPKEVTSPRGYFKALLRKLWDEGDGFSGKRPFGMSGWYMDLAETWIKAGYLEGQFDDDGYVEDYDAVTYEKYVQRCIEAL